MGNVFPSRKLRELGPYSWGFVECFAKKAAHFGRGQAGFGGLDVSVRRNAFGNQLDSFEVELDFEGVSGPAVHAAFIRAPIVERVGENVEVLSTLSDGRVVGVREGNLMGISFHPEVTGETRIHELFVSMVRG